jgi:MFS family permease
MSAITAELPEPRPAAPARSAAFYYGWVNLVLAALAMTATFPGRTHGLGMINKPMQAELGIGDVFHGALNFWSVLLGAAFCWPIGRLLDRFGTRSVLTATVAALGGVVIWMANVRTPTELFVSLTLTRGLGQGALSLVSMALVGKWFRRRIGTAMGVFSVLLAFGFIGVTLGIGAAVQTVGWRLAWLVLGWTLLGGLAPLSLLLVRSVPEGTRLADPLEFAAPEERSIVLPDASLAEALCSPAFWVFTLAASLFNLVFSGFTFFAQGVLEEQGFDQGTFTLVMAMLALSGIVFNLLGGWLSRSWPLGRLLAAGLFLLTVALAVFPLVRTTGGVLAFGLILGASGGVVTVVFFAMYNALYGRGRLGQIQGVAQAVSVFASALGPLLLAASRQWNGAHLFFFETAAAAAVPFAVACWLVPTGRRADERARGVHPSDH